MSINEPGELAGMRAAGGVVRRMLEAMKDECGRELPPRNSTKWAPA